MNPVPIPAGFLRNVVKSTTLIARNNPANFNHLFVFHHKPMTVEMDANTLKRIHKRIPEAPVTPSMPCVLNASRPTYGAPANLLHSGFRIGKAIGEEKNAPSVISTISKSNSGDDLQVV